MNYQNFLFVALLSWFSNEIYASQTHKFNISIYADNDLDSSIILTVYGQSYLPNLTNFIPPASYEAKLRNGKCNFSFELPDSMIFYSLKPGNNSGYVFDQLMAEAGDSIYISIKNHAIKFSGNNAKKYEIAENIRSHMESIYDSLNSTNLKKIASLRLLGDTGLLRVQAIYFNETKIINDSLIHQLNLTGNNLSDRLFNVLYAEIIGKYREKAVSSAYFYYLNGNIARSRENFDTTLRFMKAYGYTIPEQIGNDFAYSPSYIYYLNNLINLELFLDDENTNYFDLLKQKFRGLFYDKLATYKILLSFQTQENLDSLLTEIIPNVNLDSYKKVLTSLAKTFRVGSKAFDFKLPDRNGKMTSLGDFKGKLVLLHFWFKGCAPCALYYRNTLSKVEEKFKNNKNVIFIAISIDSNKSTWIKAIDDNIYTSSQSVNLYTEGKGPNHEVCSRYFVAGAPSPFLIDQDGRLITTNVYELGGGVNANSGKLMNLLYANLKGMGQ